MNEPLCDFAIVRSGAGGPAGAARNAAATAAHACPAEIVAVAAVAPVADNCWSSTASFVFGATGTRSSIVKPEPPVNVAVSAVDSNPRIRSPLVAGIDGLASVALLPSAAAGVPSSELVVATPAYSKIANRSVPAAVVSVIVTVFGPAPMFSA